jgi:ABC-type multidrug transport system fused ATPase/permease subunit
VSQILGGVKELMVLGREQCHLGFYRRSTAELVRSTKVFNVLNTMPRLIIETTVVAVVISLMILVLLRGEAASAAIPLLTVFALAAIRMTPSVTRIVACINSIRFYSPALASVAKDLRDHAAQRRPMVLPGATSAAPRLAPVELSGVGYRHPRSEQWILRDINLHIQQSESLAITGRSGAGKSTLVDILFGLLPPAEGSIRMNGVPLGELPPAWRTGIGYVPQTIFLLDDTVRRNVAFGIDDDQIDDARLWRALELAQVDSYVAKLPAGLDTAVGERGIRLSGGERQRIGIARALYSDPQILVFDEATSALDNQTESQIADTMLALGDSRVVIVIAHRLTTIRQCRRVAFLDAGTIADQGGFDELFERNPAFRAMTRADGRPVPVASAA